MALHTPTPKLHLICRAFLTVFSVVYAQPQSSYTAIEPAATTIPGESSSGAQLFKPETTQLTDEVIRRIDADQATAEYSKLFHFNDPSNNSSLPPSGFCKSFPGDSTWPSKEAWDVFDALSGGALIPTVPLAAPCYKNWGIYSSERCAAVIANFSNEYYHENDPTSVMWPIFQGKTCLPIDTPNGDCLLGGFPVYSVNATNVAQIQLGLNFARNSNIRLVIKNTGHDFLGKSSGAGALNIWTHNLKEIQFFPDFKGPGYSGAAMKVGAGVTVREIYVAADKYGVSMLGGICEGVGYAGGYISGGGHTPLSGYYGMAADSIVALEVVTADGRFVTATEDCNPELYWAMRGGGGSTYGVVTSVVARAHPKMPVTTSKFNFSTSDTVSDETFWKGIRAYFEHFIRFTDAHTYSYFWIYPNFNNASYHMEMMPFIAPNYTVESFNELVKPWFDQLKELGIPFEPVTQYFDSYYPAFNAHFGNEQVGDYTSRPGNRLFPRRNFEDPAKFNATFEVLKKHSERGRVFGGYHQGPMNRLNVDNAVNPAWREVAAYLIAAARAPPNATAAEMQNATNMVTDEIIQLWKDVAPDDEGGGSYMNEANVMEHGWQTSFYGIEHYPKLLAIKRKYDPTDLFYATTAVGSEYWEVRDGDRGVQTQDGRLCRV